MRRRRSEGFKGRSGATRQRDGRDADEFDAPNTLHPIRMQAQMHYLYGYYQNSTRQAVPHVRIKRVDTRQGSYMSQDPNGGGGQFHGWGPASGLELSG